MTYQQRHWFQFNFWGVCGFCEQSGTSIRTSGGTVLAFLNNHLPKASRTQHKCIHMLNTIKGCSSVGLCSFPSSLWSICICFLTKCVFMNFQHNAYVAEIPHFRDKNICELTINVQLVAGIFLLLPAYLSCCKMR